MPARCVESYWPEATSRPTKHRWMCKPTMARRNQSPGLSVAVRNAGRSNGVRFSHPPGGREGPAHFLDKFEGILQTDAYAAYDRGVGGVGTSCTPAAGPMREGALSTRWKLNKQDAASIRAVELMDELFAIDAQARNDNMDHAASACCPTGERLLSRPGSVLTSWP